MVTLKADKLILREFKEKDLDCYRLIRSNPDFKQYYSEEDSTIEKSDFLLKLFISQANEIPRTCYQLAIENEAGRLIGSCGIRIISLGDKKGSFGSELAREYWGQGFSLIASRTIIDFGFKTLGLHRIYAETIAENKAAVTLAKRLGMRLEAEFRENRFFKGRWWNTLVLAILASEWEL
jgi:RimJ/RimL family protein N-acetyltransferase